MNDITTKEQTTASIVELNINGLLSVYRNSLHSSCNGRKFKVSGHYIDNKRGKGTYYYDKLKDTDSQEFITLFLTEKQKRILTNGEYYDFIGRVEITKSIWNSSLNVLFVPDTFEKSKEEIQLIPESKYNLLRERYDKGLVNIEALFSDQLYLKEKPSILFITGTTSIIVNDFYNQLIDDQYFDIKIQRITLSSKTPYFELLNGISGSDYCAIAIVRGGGSGLEIFNEEDLCKKFLDIDIPIITAIGHQEDQTLLEKLADIGYATPSAFGTALQKLVYKDKAIKNDQDNLKHVIVKNKELYKQEIEKSNTFFAEEIVKNSEIYIQEKEALNQKVTQLTKIIVGCIIFIVLSFLIIYFLK